MHQSHAIALMFSSHQPPKDCVVKHATLKSRLFAPLSPAVVMLHCWLPLHAMHACIPSLSFTIINHLQYPPVTSLVLPIHWVSKQAHRILHSSIAVWYGIRFALTKIIWNSKKWGKIWNSKKNYMKFQNMREKIGICRIPVSTHLLINFGRILCSKETSYQNSKNHTTSVS